MLHEKEQIGPVGSMAGSAILFAMNTTPIIETELIPEEIAKIHSFGESWLKDYQGRAKNAAPFMRREHFKKALWLWAWDRRVVFAD